MINRRQRREHNLPEVKSQQRLDSLWFVCLLVFTVSLFFSPGLPVWSDHQVSLLQWFCQQGAGTFLQLWQWEVNPLPGGWYVKLGLGWPPATPLFLLWNSFCWTWQCSNLKLHFCVRPQTRSEEGAVLLLQEEWQAWGEGGSVSWVSGRDVSLSSWRSKMILHWNSWKVFL